MLRVPPHSPADLHRKSSAHELLTRQEACLLQKSVKVDHLSVESSSQMVERILDRIIFGHQIQQSAKDVVSYCSYSALISSLTDCPPSS